jgi:hypothetical protein
MTRLEIRDKMRSQRHRATLFEPNAAFHFTRPKGSPTPTTKCEVCGQFRSTRIHRAHMPRSVATL